MNTIQDLASVEEKMLLFTFLAQNRGWEDHDVANVDDSKEVL